MSPKYPKIIQLSSFFHPSVGGVERQAEEIAAHLQERGFQVQVFTTDATHGKEKRMQRLEDQYRGLKIRRFQYRLSFGDFFRFSPALVWALWTSDYDLIHVHNSHDAHLLPALIIKTLRGKKLVLTGHNPYVVGKEKRGGTLSRWVKVFDIALRLFASQIDRYIALLESEKQVVIKKFNLKPEKVAVIPNGIQELFYAQDGNKENFWKEWGIEPGKWQLIAGAACRLNYVKGLQNLLQAVRELPQVLFVFVGGDDGYYGHLHKIYNQFTNVIFTERYLPPTEVKDFYQAIDLFLLPSLYEPFGMTVVEAMAQGKPILATNRGGTKEIVKPEFGELLDPSDQEKWKERIEYYANHKSELESKAEVAKQNATGYSWDKVISQIIAIYDQV
jgi:glycosyltransferase involved in cell wall biosynthesis